MKSREREGEGESVFKLSLIKAIVAREAPLINFSSFDTALFFPAPRDGSRRNTNVAGRERRSREHEREEEWRGGERKIEVEDRESGSCVRQPVKCGQPVMIVRAWPMVAAIFHRELSTYYVSRTQRSHRVCRADSPPPTLLFRVRPLASGPPRSFSLSLSCLLSFLPFSPRSLPCRP